MKSARFAAKFALPAAILVLTLASVAQAQLTIDDFSSGPYRKTLSSGHIYSLQTGSMYGGNRETKFFITTNPFDQPSSFQVRPAIGSAPSALIFNAGYKVGPRLEAWYGYTNPLDLDLVADSFDRIRVNFDGSDLQVNLTVELWTGTNYTEMGCPSGILAADNTPFSVDFPWATFKGGADPNHVNRIVFIFQTASSIGSNNWAATSFQAIPTGAPPATVTCSGT